MKYKTKDVCSTEIEFDIDGNKLKNVRFSKGCSGNLQAISRLVEGMELEEAIEKLSGISCGGSYTSCPDQLATALKEVRSR